MFVKARDVIRLDMTVEEGAKLVISAGLVAPEYRAKTAELAARARLERMPENHPALSRRIASSRPKR